MCDYYHVVPWYSSKEWENVYAMIYSENPEIKKEALDSLHIWKARCLALPSGIESTITLLEVHLQDICNGGQTYLSDQMLRLSYSSALMRFVNHMLDNETAKGSSLYQAAKNLGIPDWIVDLRHDTAHSNNLPSIEILREACLISLVWLQQNYWEKHEKCIQDYTSGQKEIHVDENKIHVLINYCTSLSICAQCKIKHLGAIPDPEMSESILGDAKDLFGDQVGLSNIKNVSIMSLINTLNLNAKKFLRSRYSSCYVMNVLLGEDSLILSLNLLNYLGAKPFKKKILHWKYVQCFEILLTFLHTHDLILDFILELIKVSCGSKHDDNVCTLAALWVSEILKALKRSHMFLVKRENCKADDADVKNKRELKQLFYHWFPNVKSRGLLLDLQKPIPPELTNIDYIQPILSTYNPYNIFFIRDLLNLVSPRLPKSALEKICQLAMMVASPEQFTATSSTVRTVNDLKSARIVVDVLVERDSDSDCVEVFDEYSGETSVQLKSSYEAVQDSIWIKSSQKVDWSTCPIGQLPWQIKNASPSAPIT